MPRLGYNTNGLAHLRVLDALALLADLGYDGAALTLDVGALDPFALRPGEVDAVRMAAERLELDLDVETGARFLLDPRRKHFPTLLEEAASDRARRVDFLRRAVDVAADLGAGTVSLWAGRAPDGSTADGEPDGSDPAGSGPLLDRLADGLRPVLERAAERGVRVGFEPEPGMFVERPRGYERVLAHLGHDAEALGLTLDIGHCVCTGDVPVPAVVERFASRLVAVQLDDMRPGEHVHRMFGEGEVDLPATLAALDAAGFDGLASVELSRDSHRGPDVAAEAFAKLRRALGD